MCCRTSLVPAAVLYSYVLLVCRQHRHPAFAHIAEPRWCPLLFYIRICYTSAAIAAGYIRTCCLSAVYIVDLRSHMLWSFVATHCCPTFLRGVRIPLTSPTCIRVLQNLIGTCYCATFICTAHMPSTPLICIRTCCRASLVPTAILHSHLLYIYCHYCWLHSYVLLVYHQHHRPTWIHGAEPHHSA